ncbi:MAG: hypothetical protein HOF75_08220 [Flavobacteriaceae bacterium]|nr:hypothetical protein [Flavobacteriaceae bacterium]
MSKKISSAQIVNIEEDSINGIPNRTGFTDSINTQSTDRKATFGKDELKTKDVTGPNSTLTENRLGAPIVVDNSPQSRNKGINKFITNLTRKDLARAAHFRFKISPSPYWPSPLRNVLEDINLVCDTAVFPDVALNPVEGTVGYEFPYEVVNNLTHGTFTASFLCERSMKQRKFFEDWIDHIYNSETGQASYYNEYVTSIEVDQLKHNFLDHLPNMNSEMDWTYKVKLNNVYPKSFTSQALDWSAGNKYHTMSVTFHFTDYTSETNSRFTNF